VARCSAGIEVEAVFLLDVPADECGIRNRGAIIVNVGQLAFGRLGKTARVGAIGKACHFQQNFGFGDERTGIRKIERRAEGVECDHCRPSHEPKSF
jgi:hypothetical protein